MFGQTSFLVFYATWALGGRLDGAIVWIGVLAHLSILALVLDQSRVARVRSFFRSGNGFFLVVCYFVLFLVLWIAPFNASGYIETDLGGNLLFRSKESITWLPSALVDERCREYGILLAGLLVQALMLWLYLNRLSRIERLLQVITGNAIILALVGTGFRLMRSDKILGLAEPVHGGFFASFRYHNHWTAYAILAMGCCLALTCFKARELKAKLLPWHQRPEVIWIGALFLISLTLPMTTARAGVLFLVLFWLYLGVRLAFFCAHKWNTDRLNPKRLLLVFSLLTLVATIVVFAIWSSAPALKGDWEQTKQQWAQLQEGEVGELDWARTDSWGDGWRMFRDSPVWGWGFGSHRYLYQLYARDKYRNPSGVVEHIKEFAHNDWMQYLAELGLVGLFLLVAPFIVIGWQTRAYWLRVDAPAHWLLLGGGLILMLATFEFPLSNPAVLTHFVVLVTLALKIALLDSERDRHVGKDVG